MIRRLVALSLLSLFLLGLSAYAQEDESVSPEENTVPLETPAEAPEESPVVLEEPAVAPAEPVVAPEEAIATPKPAVKAADKSIAPGAAKSLNSARFYIIPIEDAISQPTLYAVRNGVKAAIAQEFDTLIIEMDTPGGELFSTLDILETLDRFPGKTITYIKGDAISAGAIIASVTNEIYFSPRATMGAAEVVTGQGEDVNESMKRKITAFLNAKMDAYTDQYPYRSDVIKAMMDPKFEFKIGEEVISPKDELLSLNAKTAHKEYGDPPQPLLGSGTADDIDSLLDSLALGKEMTVKRFEPTWSLTLAHYIVMAAPFLIAIGMITVYMEFQIPGFGIFGVIGIICFIVAFFGHNVAGLSGHEPLLFFLIGVVFLALEIFLAPGTLFFAIPGAIIMLVSIVWSMVDVWPENTPDFNWDLDMLMKPLQNLMLGMVLGIIAVLIMARFMPRSLVWDRLVLNDAIGGNSQGGSSLEGSERVEGLAIGTEGVASTDLFPSGEIEVAGVRYEARLPFGSADRGARVRVIEKKDFGYIVEEVES